MQFLEKLSNFISKYMAVFVILVAVIALFQPWTFKWAAPNIAILLGIVMFGMGTTLRLRDFRLVFQRPRDVFVGALAQFTIMPGFIQKYVKLLPLISVVAIVLIVGGVVAVSSQRIMETGALIMLVVMLHNLLGYALGFGIAKALHMNMAKAKAISIEVGMQNSGLATSLAMMHFGAAAAIPGAIFSVWHNISGSLAANYLSSRMTKEEEKEPATQE